MIETNDWKITCGKTNSYLFVKIEDKNENYFPIEYRLYFSSKEIHIHIWNREGKALGFSEMDQGFPKNTPLKCRILELACRLNRITKIDVEKIEELLLSCLGEENESSM